MSDSYKILSFTLITILLSCSFAVADQLDTQVYDIAQELMCPVCRGQTVANSNSELAHDMRMVIRQKLQEGKTKQQILDYFTARYGDTVLSSPPKRGVNLVLWLLPLFALIAGLVFLLWFLNKERSDNNVGWSSKKKESIDKDILKKIDKELHSHNQ